MTELPRENHEYHSPSRFGMKGENWITAKVPLIGLEFFTQRFADILIFLHNVLWVKYHMPKDIVDIIWTEISMFTGLHPIQCIIAEILITGNILNHEMMTPRDVDFGEFWKLKPSWKTLICLFPRIERITNLRYWKLRHPGPCGLTTWEYRPFHDRDEKYTVTRVTVVVDHEVWISASGNINDDDESITVWKPCSKTRQFLENEIMYSACPSWPPHFRVYTAQYRSLLQFQRREKREYKPQRKKQKTMHDFFATE